MPLPTNQTVFRKAMLRTYESSPSNFPHVHLNNRSNSHTRNKDTLASVSKLLLRGEEAKFNNCDYDGMIIL